MIVDHVPQKISAICHLFLTCGGHIICQITGARRFLADLPKRGLEVSWSLMFIGAEKEVEKVKKLIDAAADVTIVEPPNNEFK